MNMSFAHTTRQMEAEVKTVTRRLGWLKLKRGDVLWAIEKGQGLKKGEKVRRLYQIRVLDVRQERLDAITQDECSREGLSFMTPGEFVRFFCKNMGCQADTLVTRIEFERVRP